MVLTSGNVYKVSMIAQGLLWVGFVLYWFWAANGISADTSIIVRTLMLLNGMIFIGLGLFGIRFIKLKVLAILFLAVNLILTFTDQIGIFDYIVFLLNIISLLSLILSGRKSRAARVNEDMS